MQRTTFFKILLGITSLGNIGLIEFDSTGLTQEHSLWNVQSLSRMAIYLGIAFCALIVYLAFPPRGLKNSVEPDAGGVRILHRGSKWLALLYFVFILSCDPSFSFTQIMLVGYRIGEWALVLFLIAQVFPQSRIYSRQDFENELISFLKIYVSVPILILMIGLVLVPSFAIELGGNAGFRLGGRLVLPTSLAVLGGMGFMLFWYTAKFRWEKYWAVLLLLITLATQTRGGVIGLILAIVAAEFMFGSRKWKILWIMGAPVALLSVFIFDFSGVAQLGTQLLLRGGDLESLITLNSRLDVWSASIQMIADKPFLGHGYIIGPRGLSNYMFQSWWVAPQAHNEILNAAVSAGIIAGLLMLSIYIASFAGLSRQDRFSNNVHKPLIGVFVQLVVFSMLAPVLSSTASPIGVILLLLIYVGLGLKKQQRANLKYNLSHYGAST